MDMDILLFFEPFARGRCMDYLAEVMQRSAGIAVEKVFNWGLRGIIRIHKDSFNNFLETAKKVTCISSLYIVYSYVKPVDVSRIGEEVIRLAEEVFRGSEVAIDVRRWNKSFPLASIEVAKIIAKMLAEKGTATPNPRAENTIVIGIERDFAVVAYASKDIAVQFSKPSIPIESMRSIVAIAEKPQTDYEIMDLIQLSRALGFELRLYKPNREAFEKVLRILEVERIETLNIVNTLDEALNGIDIAIALSMYARHNEERLGELAKRFKGKRIALVVGNEYEDVSLELRSRCNEEIRLGPLTGFAMRSSTALAYALGIIAYVWLINKQ
jgi:tRNA(Ser,Leu) C12 N-acetylase TAN1